MINTISTSKYSTILILIILHFVNSDNFSNSSNYEIFDTSIMFPQAKGFSHVLNFNDQYLFYVPFRNGTSHHCQTIRFDLQSPTFNNVSAWSKFDCNNTNSLPSMGYHGGLIVKDSIYFVPHYNELVGYHAIVVTYNTSKPFQDSSSWRALDVGNEPVFTDASVYSGSVKGGYAGGCVDENIIYFAPYYSDLAFHGKVLKLETNVSFELNAFSAYNAGFVNQLQTVGYVGCVVTSDSVLFLPFINSNLLVLKRKGYFYDPQSWSALNLTSFVGHNANRFGDGMFVSPFVYFAACIFPYQYQLDERTDPSVTSSYKGFQLSNLGSWNWQFAGVFYYESYIYYSPLPLTPFVRYDTRLSFETPSSWSIYQNLTITSWGYFRGVCALRYCYYAPLGASVNTSHARMLRFSLDSSVPTTQTPTPAPTPVPTPNGQNPTPNVQTTTATTIPTTNSQTTDNALETISTSSSNFGMIIGIIVSVLLLCAILIVVLVIFLLRRRKQNSNKNQNDDDELKQKENTKESANYQSTSVVMSEGQYMNRPNQYEKVGTIGIENNSSSNYANSSLNSNGNIYANSTNVTEISREGVQYANSPINH